MADILKMLEMFERNYDFAPAAQRDLDEIIAALRATPPADAALVAWGTLAQSAADDYSHGTSERVRNVLRGCAAALRARAVPDGMALVDVNLIDDEWMKAAMRDAGIVRAVGAPPETVIRAAISAYLLAASKAGG